MEVVSAKSVEEIWNWLGAQEVSWNNLKDGIESIANFNGFEMTRESNPIKGGMTWNLQASAHDNPISFRTLKELAEYLVKIYDLDDEAPFTVDISSLVN